MVLLSMWACLNLPRHAQLRNFALGSLGLQERYCEVPKMLSTNQFARFFRFEYLKKRLTVQLVQFVFLFFFLFFLYFFLIFLSFFRAGDLS